MKMFNFSSNQKNSLVSFLLVQLFALLFVAVLMYAVTLGSESTSNKRTIVQKEMQVISNK